MGRQPEQLYVPPGLPLKISFLKRISQLTQFKNLWGKENDALVLNIGQE